MSEDGSEWRKWRMVKTADDNESGEWFMGRGTANAEKGYCLLLFFYGSLQGFYTMV
jgi:arginine utilization protein RocB